MRHILLKISLLCLPWLASAQLYNDGGIIVVSDNNGQLFVDGSLTNTNAGELTNNGQLTVGNLTNESDAILQGSGLYAVSGDWKNTAKFFAGTSTVSLGGTSTNKVASNNHGYYRVEINKPSGGGIRLLDNMLVSSELVNISPNNRLDLNDQVLQMLNMDLLIGFDENSYIVTGDNGWVSTLLNENTTALFPIGYDASDYNPIEVSTNGTGVELGVRCLEHLYDGGGNGAPFSTDAVDAAWQLDGTAGVTLDVKTYWSAANELSFDRNDCAIGNWDGGAWHFDGSGGPAAADGNLFYQTRSGVSATGLYGVRSGSGVTAAGEQFSDASQLSVYPTPAVDKLTVSNAYGELQLFNLSGRMVLRQAVNGPTAELDLQGLPAGAYLLQSIGSDGKGASAKVFKVD